MKDKIDLQFKVYNLIENLGVKVLLGLSTSDLIVILEDGKQYKIKFEEYKK